LAERRIVLCADDYGIAPGVSAAIRDLIARGRINATSAMVVAPSLDAETAEALARVAADGRAQIGLHLTLTAPFAPLTMHYAPLHGGMFLPLGRTLRAALLRRLDAAALSTEIETQISAFAARFGRPPDFVDGHQHVHLFPQIREAVLAVVSARAPGAWLRQCGRPAGKQPGLDDIKGLLIHLLSRRFRALAARQGVATNPVFAGTYKFEPAADFASLFPRFLDGLPEGGLVMCHPGFVDAALQRLDPLTDLREREHAYLAGERFPADLAAAEVRLL
jgi:chitin disaccharide deacetylase